MELKETSQDYLSPHTHCFSEAQDSPETCSGSQGHLGQGRMPGSSPCVPPSAAERTIFWCRDHPASAREHHLPDSVTIEDTTWHAKESHNYSWNVTSSILKTPITAGTLNKRYSLPGPSYHHGLLDTHFKAKTITYLAIDGIKDTDDRSSSR